MMHGADLIAAVKGGASGGNSKTPVLFESKAEKPTDFESNMTAAIKEREAALKKSSYGEKVREAEDCVKKYKPLEFNKPYRRVSDEERNKREAAETPGKNEDKILEEILRMLSVLSNMQQAGGTSGDKQAEVLQNVEELLGNLDMQVAAGGVEETGNKFIDIKNIMTAIEKIAAEIQKNGSLGGSSEINTLKDKINELLSKNKAAAEMSTEPGNVRKAVGEQVFSRDKHMQEAVDETIEVKEPAAEIVTDKKSDESEQNKAASTDNKAMPSPLKVEEKYGLKTEKVKAGDGGDSEGETSSGKEKSMEGIPVKGEPEETKEGKSYNEAGKQRKEFKDVKAAEIKTVQEKHPEESIGGLKAEAHSVEKAAEIERPQTVQKADVIHQIVKKAELVIREERPEMRMQLEPENLGKLTLKVAVEKGLITAKFIAESHEVKQIIESNFSQLRDMLQEKGIEVESFSVSVGQEGKEFSRENNREIWQESYRTSLKKSTGYGKYGSYMQAEAISAMMNPYSYHEGKFDHRA